MTFRIYLSDPSGRQGRSQSTHDYITKHMHNTVRRALKNAGFNSSRKAAPDMLHEKNPLAGFDGLILFGGPDVDTRYYRKGYSPRKPSIRDAYELNLIYAAMQAGIPILGICRGMQLINIAFGGTLHSDIAHLTKHQHNNFGAGSYENNAIPHPVQVSGSSVLPQGAYTVASSHHQAVNEVGEGLTVTAYGHDNIIEMIEAPALNVIGTQWHPEASHVQQDDTLTPLLQNFMEVVKQGKQTPVEGLPSILSARELVNRFPSQKSTYKSQRPAQRERSEGYSLYQGRSTTYVPAWQWDDIDDDVTSVTDPLTVQARPSLAEWRARQSEFRDYRRTADFIPMYMDESDPGLVNDYVNETLARERLDLEESIRMEQVRENWL